jgi:hypothetical protein
MTHTFLLEEGTWHGKGFLIDGTNERFPFEGTISTIHGSGEWIHRTDMKLLLHDNTIEIANRCMIVPFEKGDDQTTWQSQNAHTGRLLGEFVIIGDSIFSICVSADSAFQGAEYFLKINDTTYTNRGMMSKRRYKVSSWAIEMKRVL